MAESIHLFLKANNTDIKGESTQTSLGRQDSIECIFFEQQVQTAREAGSGLATGKRQYQPLMIRKRIDKSSPVLYKALIENQIITGTLRFYRPNPTGDGTTEQYYTIVFKNAHISSIKQYLPDTLNENTSNLPPLEEVSFVFNTISWTITNGGITMEDAINKRG